MAMKVKNNLAAMRSLGQLNKNITEMGKALAKVSSGQKINSAGDDASGLVISEKMRTQLRSLDQDVQNVKNGSSMIQNASGGVQNIIDVLRTMKELAIDAANDSNTDEDRATIQKELKQRMATINDVAIGTEFNGKRLLDGTYDPHEVTVTKTVNTTKFEIVSKETGIWVDDGEPTEITLSPNKTYIKTVNDDGSRVIVGMNNVQDMTDKFKAMSDNTTAVSDLMSSGKIPCDNGFIGKTSPGTSSTWNWGTAYKESKLKDGVNTDYFEDTETNPSTPQQVIRALMHSFDKTTLQGVSAFDEAINYCTGGTIASKSKLVEKFMNDLNGSSSYTDFLETYCDIILGNDDTGAITGSDAGGSTTPKTDKSIVPETGFPVTSNGVPAAGSVTTINGLNVYWPSYGSTGSSFTAAEEHILAGLNSDWIEQCVNLVTESFGIDFNEPGTSVNNINVAFEDTNSDVLAYVSSRALNGKTVALDLVVNMHYYKDIDTTSEDGALLPSSPYASNASYLDRTIAHEFTHALMSANVDYFNELPLYVIEGMAELTHGIDDERPQRMQELLTTKKDTLKNIFSTGGTQNDGEYPYAAGYMLLRYLAKQGQGQSISSTETTYKGTFSPDPPTEMEVGIEIDFSGSTPLNSNDTLSVPDSYDGQGFSILCGGCSQYINIVFDASKNIGEGELKTYTSDGSRRDYTVGIKDATTQTDLAKAIFKGIGGISTRDSSTKQNDISIVYNDDTKELVSVGIDNNHKVCIAKNPNYPDSSNAEYVFLKEYAPSILFLDSGIVEATGGSHSRDTLPGNEKDYDENGNPVAHTEEIKVDVDTPATIYEQKQKIEKVPVEVPITTTVTSTVKTGRKTLSIHDGTQAGQYNNYYIKNMQTKCLTAGKIFKPDSYDLPPEEMLLNESDRARYLALSTKPDKQREWIETLRAAENMSVDDISVTTRKDANIAIRVLDGAIEYALDNATTLGAYLQRLQSTENNIVTTEENTTAAESTIRDADMAKEMTAYTKANILTQAAQAMLAQANQSSSDVLNLLR